MFAFLFLLLHLSVPHAAPAPVVAPAVSVAAPVVAAPAVRVPAHVTVHAVPSTPRPARGSWTVTPPSAPEPITDAPDVAEVPVLPSPPDTCPADAVSYLTDDGWGCQIG